MHHPNADESPFNPLPPVVILLAVAMSGVELVLQFGDRGMFNAPLRIHMIEDYGFWTGIWRYMWQTGLFPAEHLLRFLSYPFLHGSLTHAVFAVVIVLAIGKVVGEVFSPMAFLGVFFLSSIMGALAFAMIIDQGLLLGGYPGAYGLIGAFTFLLWVQLVAIGSNASQAFTLIGVLMGIQLVFAVLFGGGADWIADLAGFLCGFSTSFLLSPGGWSRVKARMRRE